MFRLTVILSALVLAACSSVTSDGFYKARTSHKLTPDNVHLDEFAYTSPDPYGWLYKDNDYIYRGTPVGDVGERRTRRPFGQFQEPYPSLVVPNRSMIYGAGAAALVVEGELCASRPKLVAIMRSSRLHDASLAARGDDPIFEVLAQRPHIALYLADQRGIVSPYYTGGAPILRNTFDAMFRVAKRAMELQCGSLPETAEFTVEQPQRAAAWTISDRRSVRADYYPTQSLFSGTFYPKREMGRIAHGNPEEEKIVLDMWAEYQQIASTRIDERIQAERENADRFALGAALVFLGMGVVGVTAPCNDPNLDYADRALHGC